MQTRGRDDEGKAKMLRSTARHLYIKDCRVLPEHGDRVRGICKKQSLRGMPGN